MSRANRKPPSGQTAYLDATDVADCQRIAGWAYDKSDPDAIVVIAIYDGDSLMSTIPAIGFRPDLPMPVLALAATVSYTKRPRR